MATQPAFALQSLWSPQGTQFALLPATSAAPMTAAPGAVPGTPAHMLPPLAFGTSCATSPSGHNQDADHFQDEDSSSDGSSSHSSEDRRVVQWKPYDVRTYIGMYNHYWKWSWKSPPPPPNINYMEPSRGGEATTDLCWNQKLFLIKQCCLSILKCVPSLVGKLMPWFIESKEGYAGIISLSISFFWLTFFFLTSNLAGREGLLVFPF